MRAIRYFGLAVLILATGFAHSEAAVDHPQSELRAQFQSILDGLNEDSLDKFHAAISASDMTQRIFGTRLIDPQIQDLLRDDFKSSIEQWFAESFPNTGGKEIIGTLIDFQEQGNQGSALVRYALPGYRYAYHRYDLQMDDRGRIIITDWLNYLMANRFSEAAGEFLVSMMPSDPAARRMLDMDSPTQRQVFQMRELLKAYRDKQADRYFNIVEDMDPTLQGERAILERSLRMAELSSDRVRYKAAVLGLLEKYPDEPLYFLTYIDFFTGTRDFERGLNTLVRFQESLGADDGAAFARMSAFALALGENDDSVTHALRAIDAEPTLEVGWWSLLRARTRTKDYAGAIEALSRLEDEFGHVLDPQKLAKDRFLRVLVKQQEYVDWNEARR